MSVKVREIAVGRCGSCNGDLTVLYENLNKETEYRIGVNVGYLIFVNPVGVGPKRTGE